MSLYDRLGIKTHGPADITSGAAAARPKWPIRSENG